MSSVRQLKKRYFRRQWFSSEQVLKLDDGRVEIWPMGRHGLAYDDHRARTGIRWPAHGKHALQQMPFDDLHMDRKVWKKKEVETQKGVNRAVRELRTEKHPFMERMSFRDARVFWWRYGLEELDVTTTAPIFIALNRKHYRKKGVQSVVHIVKAELGKVAREAHREYHNTWVTSE